MNYDNFTVTTEFTENTDENTSFFRVIRAFRG